MSRIGKIARLPKAVREELNRRLEDGEEGKALVAWLNGLDEVRAVLKGRFDGRPINEPNLTGWRQGGYEDWRRQQEALEAAGRLVEESAELEVLAQGHGLADRAATMAALSIGEQLMATRRMEDGAEKRRAVLKLVRGLVRLRKTDREHERAQRDAAQAERSAEMHEVWAEDARRRRSAPPPVQRSVDGRTVVGETVDGGQWTDREQETRGHGDTERGMDDRSLDDLSEAELMQRLEEIKAQVADRGGAPRTEEAICRGIKPLPQHQPDPLPDEP